MHIKYLLLLIFVQVLWSGSYVAMKIGLESFPIDILMMLRYGLSSVLLVVMTTLLKRHSNIQRKDWKWLIIISVMVYIVAPLLALRGVSMSQSLDVAVLIGLEPLLTALLAFFVLREVFGMTKVVAVILAIPGILLLSGINFNNIGSYSGLRLIGNGLFLSSLLCEGCFTVFCRSMSGRYRPLALSTYAFCLGFALFFMLRFTSLHGFAWEAVTLRSWLAVGYLVIFASTVAYTLWVVLLQKVTAGSAALSLYLQPVIGAVLGYLILDEKVVGLAWLGIILIVLAIIVAYSEGYLMQRFVLFGHNKVSANQRKYRKAS